MRSVIGRRKLLMSLPAACLPLAMPARAHAEGSSSAVLQLNAADALGHYRNLLESVRGDSYEKAAKNTVNALHTCDETLGELRTSVEKLRLVLAHDKKNWPGLQERFSAVERSMALVKDPRTGQLNEKALEALPATLETLRALASDVSKACDASSDSERQALVDEIFSKINRQNDALENVNTARDKWSDAVQDIGMLHGKCGAKMDEAAIAICEGALKGGNWQVKANAALSDAIEALKGIENIDSSMEKWAKEEKRGQEDQEAVRVESDEDLTPNGSTALNSLEQILETTKKSLIPEHSPIQPAALYFGGTSREDDKVVGVVIGQNPGLIGKVRQLVNGGKYFTPGSSTQTINCIAVCLPVWLAYRGNAPEIIKNRKSIIASAIFWGLIWGAKRNLDGELADQLQGIYDEVAGEAQA